ncbi:MAG: methyltransferase domain-containing protein [Planctomycetota bacterium]
MPLTKSLKERNRQPEWMDEPDIAVDLHHDALTGLARVNRFSSAVGSIWGPVSKLAAKSIRPLRVLDVACGGGDVATSLQAMANRKGVPIQVVGCDISETAIEFAAERAKQRKVEISFVQNDVLNEDLPGGFDLIYSSLFLHHLEFDQIVHVLKSMRSSASRCIVINDLLRSSLGYALAKWGIRVLTRSKVCHVDGPLSVEAALTMDEARSVAQQAGMQNITLRRCWPERFLMVWHNDAEQ